MRPSALVLASVALIVLTGCATAEAEKPAICDGKHRRPANIYGSVLPDIPLPGAPAAPAAGSAGPAGSDPPAPPKGPGPTSQLDRQSFAPCGARA